MAEKQPSAATPDKGDSPSAGPILAPPGSSPSDASRPEQRLEGRFHIYEGNPVPWWIALIWLSFFAFAITYLIVNLI
jgi:hypothetical protein